MYLLNPMIDGVFTHSVMRGAVKLWQTLIVHVLIANYLCAGDIADSGWLSLAQLKINQLKKRWLNRFGVKNNDGAS